MRSERPKLSFIVIARNQAKTITMCLDSVVVAARPLGAGGSEIIYVDSDSTDGSLEQVRRWTGAPVRIVRLTGAMNAAIARNAGASVSQGETLFFIDGDMALDPAFLRTALDDEGRPIHPVIGGQLPEKFYDSDWRFVADGPDRFSARQRGFRAELGGIALVARNAFEAVDGYRPELRINEDMDLGLRLTSAGYPILSLPQPIATHQTVEYFDWGRMRGMLKSDSLFYPGAIFRRHLTNPAYWRLLISHQRPTAVLVVSAMLAIAIHPAWLLLYVIYVTLKNLRRPNITFVQDFVGTTVRSICFLLGIPFFFPPRVPADRIRYDVEERAGPETGHP